MTRGGRTVVVSSASFATCFGLYLLFAGSLGGAEIGAGVVAAALVATYAGLQHRGQSRPLFFRAPWLQLLGAMLAALATDSVRVGSALVRACVVPQPGPTGSVARQPFNRGGDQPVDAGRRALVTVASSLAPNGFVLEIEPSPLEGCDKALLIHRLAPAPTHPDPEWPV